MKKVKYFIIAFGLIISIVITGGLIKYNMDLNAYIHATDSRSSDAHPLNSNDPAQVYIVGSVHNETDYIKREDLYRKIDEIGPDLILFELEPDKVQRMIDRTDYLLQLWKVFRNQDNLMEEAVTLKYISHNPKCIVRSYEWETRTQYYRKHDIEARPQALLEGVVALYSQGSLTTAQSVIVEKYIEQSQALKKIYQNAVLADINNVRTDSLVRERQYSQYKHMADVASERPELSQYMEFLGVFRTYWGTRNKAMVQNILKQIKLNPSSKIVVLNGFYHRYYLIDGLLPYETEYNFTLKGIEYIVSGINAPFKD